ncbi:phthiocerol/phenolphthiocerol synthesis polyketide synthase type I PpsD-like [Colossoma macropomum]|uniref:phthiocerol/phenolphthiocerol synthesis polyketide synthase type I PpsD-like n=1 Tax=Colossoma macropomum TaxID=42526 RepID=UPI001864B4F3|nr:phthiocerol/phenolphthiocerol synthesis polyketide synthase type I PpsD-like [Colossoma macropomum]
MEETSEEIAVIGIGCNFPGGEGVDNFWKVLLEGKNCTVEIPNERFDRSYWYDSDQNKLGKTYTARAALIDGINEFDHRLFGVTEAESSQMDPQHKLLLHCTYRAFENAGIPVEKASGTKTGVFLGLMNRDYELNKMKGNPNTIDHWTGTGMAMSIAANRISYTFNLTGPSLSIDSACSSSLVALHFGCQAIKQGDCEMALCGGVSCIFEPHLFVALSRAKMISPDGTSKPFSKAADGYGRGEGCGIVLLKPLKKAIVDSDHIWGIIRKTAVNQDGRTASPITKPSMVQQEELLSSIYCTKSDMAGVQYIEAHGTGTPVGDPVEANSISKVIAKARPAESGTLCVGSVKGNIGHTESAAGVAGLIKVLLMMKHETIVPSLFYSENSASIDAKALNINIPTKAKRWKTTSSVSRVAGINNFGFGGTNAHAIVKQYKEALVPKTEARKSDQYFVLSAASEKSLVMMIADTVEKLDTDTDIDLQSLAYTSACRRSHVKNEYRKAFRASSLSDLKEQLHSAKNRKIEPSQLDPRLIFVFCGNGLTYRGMCRQLLKEEPVFREKVRDVECLFQSYKSISMIDMLESDSEDVGCQFSNPEVIQPLLFAIQVALFKLIKKWGIRPDAVLGHSVGEVAAAHCSGLLSLEDAVKVIYHRSTLQCRVTGGKMLVVSNMAVSEVLKLLPSYSGRVCLAAYNSPQSCTLSGDADSINDVHKRLSTMENSKHLFLHVLEVPAAYHSHMMDPILSEVKSTIGSLKENEMVTELYSTVTGNIASHTDFCTGTYWAQNIREQVAFEKAVRSATKDKKNVVFVEIGPRRALQRNIIETVGKEATVLSSVQPEKDHETMLTLVSKLFETGFQVDWAQLYRGCETNPIALPRYQFDCVKKPLILKSMLKESTGSHPVLTQTFRDGTEFNCDLTSSSLSYLNEHKNNGIPIIPGSFYAELGLAACMADTKPRVPLNMLQLSVSFHRPFVYNQNSPEMKVTLEPAENETKFNIHSSAATFASGSVMHRTGGGQETRISLDSVYKRCTSVMSYDECYNNLRLGGFQHESVFRNEGFVHYGEQLREAISTVSVPEELLPQLHDYHIHPVVLDYFMQLLPMTVANTSISRPGFPAAIGSLTVFEPLQERMAMYLRATEVGTDYLDVCGCFTDKDGKVLVEIKQVRLKFLKSQSYLVEEYFYHTDFRVISEEQKPTHFPKALVFADQLGLAEALKNHLAPTSKYISFKYAEQLLCEGFQAMLLKLNISAVKKTFEEILFIWSDSNLTTCNADRTLETMANCCEVFRQIITELKSMSFPNSIRTVTFRAAETTVDQISPGFVLSGMTRACAAEASELLFQLVDISSVSREDVEALAEVLKSYPCSKYPELVVKDGQILQPNIVHTPLSSPHSSVNSIHMPMVILKTADPYKITCLSAIPSDDSSPSQIQENHVEVQLSKVCVHSSDYYPVSVSALKFGQTIYWNSHTTQDHKLLALDFSGTVTAVGKAVSRLKIGDRIVSCFPIAASSKIEIPEDVCYKAKKVPFLRNTPCVSFLALSWAILQGSLPKAKQQRRLDIFSSAPDACFLKVLTLTAAKSGWNVFVETELRSTIQNANKFDVFVLLPPFDTTLFSEACRLHSVKHIVAVCEDEHSLSLCETILREENASACVHPIQISRILERGLLKLRRPQIYKWIKSMHLDSKSLDLLAVTVQKAASGGTDILPMENSESYICSKTIRAITLRAGDPNNQSEIPFLLEPKQNFQKNSVYIVTGGLSGLGFETVKFIAQRGGGYILILSRSSPSPTMQQEISTLRNQYETVILSLRCDVSVLAQVEKAIAVVRQSLPSCPIKGVFHSAVVLHDGLIESLNKAEYEKVLKPKVSGALNLHHATKQCKLDYFVCYSSITSFIGNAAQSNYAAANSFLDTFCHYRRNIGLAGQSINWGALNLGLLLNKDTFQKFLESKGMMIMEVNEIHQCLQECLLLNRPQQVVCKFNFKNLRTHVLSQNASLRMRFSSLVLEAIRNDKQSELTMESVKSTSSPREYVRSVLCSTLGVKEGRLNEDTTLAALGVDSMLAMTLQNLFAQERGFNIPIVKFLDPSTTLATLVTLLTEANDTEPDLIDSSGRSPSKDSDELSTAL